MTVTNYETRDYAAQPLTAIEAIELFRAESFWLAMATEAVIEEAAELADHHGDDHIASDIHARWDDYQEELRCMAAEFM